MRLRQRRPLLPSPIAAINVTPFVDVMLVLLIVFMITAPLLNVGVPVDLPQTNAAQQTKAEEPLIITLNQEKKLFLQEKSFSEKKLFSHLAALREKNPKLRIYIRADKNLSYGEVMHLMGKLSALGFEKVALVTETNAPLNAQKK